MKREETRSRQAVSITRAGLVVNVILTVIKYIAGFAGHSSAMVADATHSLSDLVTDVIVLLGFRVVDKPADKGHQYGHGKIETLTGAICGVLLLLAGIGIFYSGASKIGCFIRGTVIPRPGLVAFFAALVSVVSKEILFRYTRRVAERITSSALKAQAWHHRSDAMSSLAVLAGLGGAVFLGSEWVILDPLAALLVSFFIARIAFQILKETLNELIEGSLDGDAGTAIWELMSSTRGVYNVHNVRTRKIGHYFAVEAHVMVDRNLSLLEAHDISIAIEKKICSSYGKDTLVTIHTEPGPKDRHPDQNI